jgi:hypothetical protein
MATIPLGTTVLWTRTLTGNQTDGSTLQADVITAILADGWTFVSGTTYQSPTNAKGQKMQVTFTNSSTQFDIEAKESDGTGIDIRSMNVSVGNPCTIHTSSHGIHVQNIPPGTEEKIWTFFANLEGTPGTVPTRGNTYIAGHRTSGGTPSQWTNQMHSFRVHRFPSGIVSTKQMISMRETWGGVITPHLYPDGSYRFTYAHMTGIETTGQGFWFGGMAPGVLIGPDLLADGTQGFQALLDQGIEGTYEVMEHGIHTSQNEVKFLLKTG